MLQVSSYDTVGNAYFCFSIHAVPAGWRCLAVVTSQFHMPRSEQLFRDMGRTFASCVYQQPDRSASFGLQHCSTGPVWSDKQECI